MQLANRLSEYIRACFTGIWIESHEHQDAPSSVTTNNGNWPLGTSTPA